MNSPALTSPTPLSVPDLIGLFLRGRNASTLTAYRADLKDFAGFMGALDSNEAAQVFLSHGPGHANRLTFEYRAALISRQLSPASVNRKLAALRSLTKLARTVGLIAWSLEVENLPAQQYRDTRGPQESGFKQILRHSEQRTDRKGIRDRAILCLLHDVALRRGEVVSLDITDCDLMNRTLAVKGKGRYKKQQMSLPERTRSTLMEWVTVRGNEPGPLFTNCSRVSTVKGGRMSGTAVYQIVKKLGTVNAVKVTPHGLRHTAITTAVERAQHEGIGLEKVQQFSRHRKMATLQVYCDRHEDWQGRIAGMVAR